MKSILIADDEYDIAMALELLLVEEGYRVTVVSNGRDALAALTQSVPDLVILDVMMPFVTGLEALKLIRANPRLAPLPVLLISAVTPKASRKDYRWSAFMRKPFDVDRILETVKTLLDQKAHQD